VSGSSILPGSTTTNSFTTNREGHGITNATPILDAALATADAGLSIFRVRPMGKRPLAEGWQDEATTDPAIITRWFAENPRINYGVPTGAANNLYVVDLDGPEAQAWWRSTGLSDGAKVATPSGPDRFHHYFAIDGEIELPNTQGSNFPRALHPHVDTRGEGGYVVGPGSLLSSGSYRGKITNVPAIAQELLDLLPAKQAFTHEAPVLEGDKVDEASSTELKRIAWCIAELDTLPRVWSEGAGWRSTMYQVACWLSRMVNSPHYAITESAALTILLTHTPTDEKWGKPQILEQWASAQKSTAGQAAEMPAAKMPNLLPIIEVLNVLPEFAPGSGVLFTGLVFDTPEGPSTDWWKIRRMILVECFRSGLKPEQAVTVAFASAAGRPLQGDPLGLNTLWAEAEKARAAVAAESGEGFEAPADAERPNLSLVKTGHVLLGDAERQYLVDDDAERARLDERTRFFGNRYFDWAATRVALMNPPYHRLNLWIILSLIFAETGFVPDPAKPIGLNLFGNILGKSTTGKSESAWLMNSVLKACFPKHDSPNIGGNASPNALIEKLIERDGKPSLFITDEAHGLFKQMQGDGSWMSGLKELLAALYEGEVPVILRNGKKDISGVDASTYFSAHLMGTVDGMTKALDEEMWVSGLLPRFIWAIGAELEATPDTYVARQVESYSAGTYDAMPKQWNAEFATTKERLKAYGTLPLAVLHEKDALDRHTELQRTLSTLARGHRQEELLKPTLIRFGTNVRKCAILAALVDGSPVVTLRHELIAIEAAEEWLDNIFLMVEATTATAFTRSVNDVEQFVARQKGSEARIEAIYRRFQDPVRIVDEWVTQLVRSGRVSKDPTRDGSFTLKIKSAALVAPNEMRIAA
jgi:hypothetical protein